MRLEVSQNKLLIARFLSAFQQAPLKLFYIVYDQTTIKLNLPSPSVHVSQGKDHSTGLRNSKKQVRKPKTKDASSPPKIEAKGKRGRPKSSESKLRVKKDTKSSKKKEKPDTVDTAKGEDMEDSSPAMAAPPPEEEVGGHGEKEPKVCAESEKCTSAVSTDGDDVRKEVRTEAETEPKTVMHRKGKEGTGSGDALETEQTCGDTLREGQTAGSSAALLEKPATSAKVKAVPPVENHSVKSKDINDNDGRKGDGKTSGLCDNDDDGGSRSSLAAITAQQQQQQQCGLQSAEHHKAPCQTVVNGDTARRKQHAEPAVAAAGDSTSRRHLSPARNNALSHIESLVSTMKMCRESTGSDSAESCVSDKKDSPAENGTCGHVNGNTGSGEHKSRKRKQSQPLKHEKHNVNGMASSGPGKLPKLENGSDVTGKNGGNMTVKKVNGNITNKNGTVATKKLNGDVTKRNGDINPRTVNGDVFNKNGDVLTNNSAVGVNGQHSNRVLPSREGCKAPSSVVTNGVDKPLELVAKKRRNPRDRDVRETRDRPQLKTSNVRS